MTRGAARLDCIPTQRVGTRKKHVIPAGIAGIQKPWMAIPKQAQVRYKELLNEINRSHPCALDSGNPCRNDGLPQTLVYNDERSAWERENPKFITIRITIR